MIDAKPGPGGEPPQPELLELQEVLINHGYKIG